MGRGHSCPAKAVAPTGGKKVVFLAALGALGVAAVGAMIAVPAAIPTILPLVILALPVGAATALRPGKPRDIN